MAISIQQATAAADTAQRQAEAEVVVASYPSYAEAERAVDLLSDRGFPVERVTIVARDVIVVERVLGRMDTARAGEFGASVGGLLGLTLGLLFGAMNWIEPTDSMVILGGLGLFVGTVCGAILGIIGHMATGGGRDFESVTQMEAGHFDVVTDQGHAQEARRILHETTRNNGS